MYQISIEKSVARILATPVGTRVMRPEFGSRLHELLDRRTDDGWMVDCVRHTYEALDRWEPRISVGKVTRRAGDTMVITIEATVKESGDEINMEVTLEFNSSNKPGDHTGTGNFRDQNL